MNKIKRIGLLFLFLCVSSLASDFENELSQIINAQKEKVEADEIIVSIMDNKTNEVIYVNNKELASNYLFEPGSVIKPISISLALKHKRVKEDELFYAHNEYSIKKKNGKYIKIKNEIDEKGFYNRGAIVLNNRWTIKDDVKLKKHYLSVEDVIINSSNIGTLQIANRLTAEEFYEGFKNFGFADNKGQLPLLKQFKGNDDNNLNIYKSTVSYGQGMTASFNQILNAYNMLSKDDSSFMYKALNKRAEKVYKSNEKFKDIDLGIKLGTAQIARGGIYLKEYIASSFGYASSENNRYVIGVTVLNPISKGQYWYYYYASQSALPLFNDIVRTIIKYDYLK